MAEVLNFEYNEPSLECLTWLSNEGNTITILSILAVMNFPVCCTRPKILLLEDRGGVTEPIWRNNTHGGQRGC